MGILEDRQALRQMLMRRSVRRGQFKLVSGMTSDVYVDGKLTTCHGPAMPLIGRLFLDRFAQRGWKPAAVGGLSIGADPIVAAIAHESVAAGNPIDSFLVRKEAKKHGTQKFIEGIENVAGLPVVVIDDVCTTGGSTADAIEKARAAGMVVLGAVCLVDRLMGAGDKLKTDFDCEFDNVFKITELLENSAGPSYSN